MASNSRPPTLSQALLSLGRINAVENSIAQGVSAFYRARKCVVSSAEMSNDVKQDVKRFGEFCEHFTKIVSAEGKDFKSIEGWLMEKNDNELTSRIETFLVIYPLFPSNGARKKWAEEFEELGKIAKDVQRGHCEQKEIDAALKKLQKLGSETNRLESEKKLSEKVLSARTLTI